jgi:membrane associated rhomboid family serine protease/Zn-finger nucleic acid-binding protein
MASAMDSIKREVGIRCLSCGNHQLPPNRDVLDNWTCGYCYAGFLSLAMLTNLLPRELIEQISRERKKIREARPCVLCHSAMERTEVVEGDSKVEIEVCRRCRLIWLDSGSLTRLARLMPQEKIQESIQARIPQRTANPVRARAKKPAPEAPASLPWCNLILVGLMGGLIPIVVFFPDLVLRRGFLPAQPLRDFGATMITSLFLNDRSELHALLALLLLGSFTERRLGAARYCLLFLLSGIVGRVTFLLLAGKEVDTVIGVSPAVAGIAAYSLFSLPIKEMLYPEERWRSSGGTLIWWLVGILGVAMLAFGWDYFHVAFTRYASGGDGGSSSGTLLAWVQRSVSTPGFRAHLFAAGAGLLFVGSRTRL